MFVDVAYADQVDQFVLLVVHLAAKTLTVKLSSQVLVSEMTYYVLSGTLNPTHSVIHSLYSQVKYTL